MVLPTIETRLNTSTDGGAVGHTLNLADVNNNKSVCLSFHSNVCFMKVGLRAARTAFKILSKLLINPSDDSYPLIRS